MIETMQRILRIIGAVALAAAVACAVVACAPANNTQDEARRANQSYMSQVNSIMTELGDKLGSFTDAVSRGDAVGMRAQAANACKVLDELTALEPPEVLSDVHEQYVQGSEKLRKALEEYVVLYADAKAAESGGSALAKKDFDNRMSEIQKLYDEGIAALSEGDELAASK